MKWFWGTVLIILGLIFLGINTNYISPAQLNDIVRFWPIILIIYGTGLIFRHSKHGWIITLIITLLSLTFVYLATIGNTINYPEKSLVTKRTTNYFSKIIRQDTINAKFTINTGAVDFHLDSTSNYLIKGNLISNYLKPELNTNTSGNTSITTLNTNSKLENWPKGNNELSVSITDQLPIEMILNTGASKMDLNFSSIRLKKLDINTGATEANIQLGDSIQNNAIINIASGASSINISFPKSIGIKFKNESPVSNINFKDFNKIDRSNYESKDYANKKIKIEIVNSSGASSINISSK